MTAEIRLKFDDRLVAAGLAKAPEVIQRDMDATLDRGSQETARLMRDIASRYDSRGARRESVRAEKLGVMHYFVGPGVAYARAAEEGTGPAAGRASYMPDPRKLEDYVRTRHASLRRLRGRKGSVTRRQQLDEIRDRAWGLALHIKQHGTKAAPIVEPTRTIMEPKLRVMAAASVNKSLREIFSA